MKTTKIHLPPLIFFCLIFFGCSAHILKHHPHLAQRVFEKKLSKSEKQVQKYPKDRTVLLEICKNLTQYSYVFVLRQAEILQDEDFMESRKYRLQANGLFRKAYEYGLESLEIIHPGFRDSFYRDGGIILKEITKEEIDYLYWIAAALGGMISTAKGDPYAIADLPKVGYLIDRALELDEAYEKGSLHEFLISFTLSRPDAPPNAIDVAKHHFDRAVELSEGNRASAFVSYAESICILEQNRKEFLVMLDRALAVDVNMDRDLKLANIVAQERAEWLKERVDDLFF
ncbi:MAG: TRAP transporter TatT component family protein [Fidelibacterota bacterium]